MLEVKKDSSLPILPSGLRKELLLKIEKALEENKKNTNFDCAITADLANQMRQFFPVKQTLTEKKKVNSDRLFSTETVLKVRQAFFNTIVKLFMDYKTHVNVTNDQIIFEAKEFIKNSDCQYVPFYKEIFDQKKDG